MKTLVIAEPGSTHGGSLDQAYRLIDLAAAVGTDVCKFQWTSSPERLAARRHAPDYLDAYRLIAFPRDWLPLLAVRCIQRGIEFMATTYLPEDISVVAPYVKRFKVASFEAGDRGFLDAHQPFDQDHEMLISLGMFSGDAWRAIIDNSGRHDFPSNARLLHCVSSYPATLDQMNIRVFHTISWQTDRPVLAGLSDHSRHPWTGALAVAAGAEIVEFHFRLDDTDPGNADYAVSRSLAEAMEYVNNIRVAETMLGDGVKRVMPSETPMLRYRVRP